MQICRKSAGLIRETGLKIWKMKEIIQNMKNDGRRKHVAFYIGSLHKGGAERVFVNLAEFFLQEGYRVTMVTQYKKENEYDLPDGVERVISDITQEELNNSRIINFYSRNKKT